MPDHLIVLYCCMAVDCSKAYNTKFNLKRHVDTHHLRVKHFVCEYCRHEFSSKQNMVEHRYLHSGLKPFRCTACPASFRQASQLSLHKRSHLSCPKSCADRVLPPLSSLLSQLSSSSKDPFC